MKPLLILIISIYFPSILSAQTYTIPNADEQPNWVFPIWFEDATGARDTLYFGYDPSAVNFGIPSADTIFGEFFTPFDTTKFGVFWEQGLTIQETLKTLIWRDLYQSSIFFNKAKLPVTITWDNNLFYSDILPFPDNSPLPNAWGLIHCASVGFDGCQETIEGAIVLTDTPNYDIWSTFETDSLWFNSGDYEYFSNYLNFEVLQYGYVHGWMVIKPQPIEKYGLVPNPAIDYFKLYADSYLGGTVYISDIFGRIVKEYININNNTFIIQELPSGIYFINFYKNNIHLSYKILKL